MAKKKVKHEPTDYHTAVNLRYNGVAGEYLTSIPARDLSPLDVVTTAAYLDMSVGDFVGLVTLKSRNKNGDSLYIIPVKVAPIEEINTDDKPIEKEESHG